MLSDPELVARIEADATVSTSVINEYYRRCIPLYLDFLGVHWHTGFYRDEDEGISARDQVRMIDHVAEMLDLGPGQRVLDVGCGTGATACHLNLQHGCDAVGLTPVAEQKQLAEQFAHAQNAQLRIDIGHAEKLPYPDASFDAVIFFESSCHFTDRGAFFAEACRVLKPGGRCGGEDWLATDLSNHRNERWIAPICKSWAIPRLGDAIEYQNLMQTAGFDAIEIVDLRKIMPLHKGFAVTPQQQDELSQEIVSCNNDLLKLTLKGLANLGRALQQDAFTIARLSAKKSADTN